MRNIVDAAAGLVRGAVALAPIKIYRSIAGLRGDLGKDYIFFAFYLSFLTLALIIGLWEPVKQRMAGARLAQEVICQRKRGLQ